jgi:hypothetical protein
MEVFRQVSGLVKSSFGGDQEWKAIDQVKHRASGKEVVHRVKGKIVSESSSVVF